MHPRAKETLEKLKNDAILGLPVQNRTEEAKARFAALKTALGVML